MRPKFHIGYVVEFGEGRLLKVIGFVKDGFGWAVVFQEGPHQTIVSCKSLE